MIDLSFGYGMPLYNAFLYHIQHANIFHLAGNLLVMYQLNRIWWPVNRKGNVLMLISAYICASLPALCTLTWKELPTCGLSAIIFALIAQANAKQHYFNWKLLILNSILALIPAYNWRIHMAAYILAYATWRVLYGTLKTTQNEK